MIKNLNKFDLENIESILKKIGGCYLKNDYLKEGYGRVSELRVSYNDFWENVMSDPEDDHDLKEEVARHVYSVCEHGYGIEVTIGWPIPRISNKQLVYLSHMLSEYIGRRLMLTQEYDTIVVSDYDIYAYFDWT